MHLLYPPYRVSPPSPLLFLVVPLVADRRVAWVALTRHALREMDIELMRKLSSRVNVIPVIGRSDSLTPSELVLFKKRVMEDIEQSVYRRVPASILSCQIL